MEQILMCHQDGLFKVIKYFGSQRALADAISASQRVISHWVNREKRIPYQYVVAIFYLMDGRISLDELAPENSKINRKIEHDFYLALEHTRNKTRVIG